MSSIKKITIVLLTALLISISFSAIINAEKIGIKEKKSITKEKTNIFENKNPKPLKKDLIIPRTFAAILVQNKGFNIIDVKADEIEYDNNTTYYKGNVEIKANLTGESEGFVCSYIANRIGNLLYLKRGIDPSILPGWYTLKKEFTLKAQFFFLTEYMEFEDNPPIMTGFGFFVRITD